ncbi:MAG: hypothetical protein HQ567_00090 [Candidatus Nealsonbacteria bacterium]|nr:hypothetical protein [Candidatus Nealsonbacteria bacterium]
MTETAKKPDAQRKPGRPKKPIDAAVVEKLAARFSSKSEIARIVGCDPQTITNRFSEEFDKGRAEGKKCLREMQWKAAEKGNVTMLIFLGKQYLGQADRVQAEVETTRPFDTIELYAKHPEIMERALQLEADLADALAADRGEEQSKQSGAHDQ